MTVREQVQQLLNRYLEAELGRLLDAFEADAIAVQRARFLEEFGAERLAVMDGAELLRLLPYNRVNDQPLDYWLEFRNDAVFQQRLFGGIAGGSAAKFGVWQDRRSGRWRAKPAGSSAIREVSENAALQIVLDRRREMLAAVQALQAFSGASITDLDPAAVQTALVQAAPRWHASAWLHKYLHLHCPERVTANATLAHLQANLYRLGLLADGAGPYALDIKIIQFWNGLPALAQLPVWLRYRFNEGLRPRGHWCCSVPKAADAKALLAAGTLALGPDRLANLTGLWSLSRKSELRDGLLGAYQEAGLPFDPAEARDLLRLGGALQAGDLVALLEDPSTVRAIGTVESGYQYWFKEHRPHRVVVRWLHREPFRWSAPVSSGRGRLLPLQPGDPRTAQLEAVLLAAGLMPEPAVTKAREPGGESAAAAALEPPAGIIGRLIAMLERKGQIILYGPPGTGKTYYAQQTARELVARHNFGCPPAQLSTARNERMERGNSRDPPYIALCTFHPMYGYEDFIEGYRPERDGFSLKPGLFRQVVEAAQAQPGKRFVLIIDEINRGNIPKIFGELITLLEPAQRGRLHTVLPLSGERLSVPPNLYLIGTMNTADRSILALDTALRRRFGFQELPPRPDLLEAVRLGDGSLAAWLKALNRHLVGQLGQDGRHLQVGHGYFMVNGRTADTLPRIAEIIREDIWPLLQEYCYDNPRALAAILAADRGGPYDTETADLRYELFEPGREAQLLRALTAMVNAADDQDDGA
jgi:5-methylcytosine-specific restriction protein B